MSKQQEQAAKQYNQSLATNKPIGTVTEVNKPNLRVWAECILSQYTRYGATKK